MVPNVKVSALLAACVSFAQVAYANTGSGTWFYPGLGSCGYNNGNNDFVAALSTAERAGGHCGQAITVNYQGRSIVATVVDTCPGCGQFDVDLSPAAFSALASLDVGRIQLDWHYN